MQLLFKLTIFIPQIFQILAGTVFYHLTIGDWEIFPLLASQNIQTRGAHTLHLFQFIGHYIKLAEYCLYTFNTVCVLIIITVYCPRICAAIAQLGERQTEDLKVPGSIPGRGNPTFYLFVAALP